MADTPDVEAAEITPEQFEGEEQKSASAESSPAKEEPTPATEADKSDSEPTDTETEGDNAEETETPPTKADERKTQLNEEIRDLVSQRNALREEVSQANAEVYQPASENDLIDQGLSATDAKVEALRQEIALRDYNEKVAEAQLTLSSESQRVLSDFPTFNSDSNQYDKELAEEAAQLLQGNLIYDENTNQIIGSHVSPYQLYKTLARAAGISTAKGQLQGQQDTEKMLANADNSNTAAPKVKAKDPLTELWETEL